MRVNAIRVKQPYGIFYLTSIKVRDLLDVIHVDRFRAVIDKEEEGYYKLGGLQRRYSVSRKKQIAKFVKSIEAVFPNTIILSVNNSEIVDGEESEIEGDEWKVFPIQMSEEEVDLFTLEIGTRSNSASVIDGQHRLYGFFQALAEIRDESRLLQEPATLRALEMELPCSVYFDLKPEQQAYIFATINFNQKPVDKSLAFELFNVSVDEDAYTWSPDKLAVFLTRRLNVAQDDTILKYNSKTESQFSEGPLNGRIRIANQEYVNSPADSEKWLVSTATVVNGILSLISKNSAKDRSVMYDNFGAKNRSMLQYDGSPMRYQFLLNRNDEIYYAISHYFSVVDNFLWKRIGNETYFTKTIGIQALFSLLKRLIVPDSHGRIDLSMKYFVEKLNGLKRIKVDMVSRIGQASGIGKTDLTYLLYIATDNVTEEDYAKMEVRRAGFDSGFSYIDFLGDIQD